MHIWRTRQEPLSVFSYYAKRYKNGYISVNKKTNFKIFKNLSIYTIWNGWSLKTISRYCPFQACASALLCILANNKTKKFGPCQCNLTLTEESPWIMSRGREERKILPDEFHNSVPGVWWCRRLARQFPWQAPGGIPLEASSIHFCSLLQCDIFYIIYFYMAREEMIFMRQIHPLKGPPLLKPE